MGRDEVMRNKPGQLVDFENLGGHVRGKRQTSRCGDHADHVNHCSELHLSQI